MRKFKSGSFIKKLSYILACNYITPPSFKFPLIKNRNIGDISIFYGKENCGFRLCGVLDV